MDYTILPKVVSTLGLEDCRVVYPGAEGSYAEAAMQKFFGENANAYHVRTFPEVFDALEKDEADYGIVPIENSTAGSINENYDTLTKHQVYIVGEQIIKVEHCLLVYPGTRFEDIEIVYSHPQSFMQSSLFLEAHPEFQRINMQNNAFAAQRISEEKKPNIAAIAGEHAAKVYGLEILKTHVNNEDNNSTRFIVVSKKPIFLNTAKKVSICFEVKHETGSLYKALGILYDNEINMNMIESRPVENKAWEYRFFVDVDGNLTDDNMKRAIEMLSKATKNFRVLGNY